ncbi:uncharacterized protein ACB058_002811 isoform 1-T1 [Synchiropus picturatus]
MRNLALWAVVGFLSVVCTHTAVTQSPAKLDDDVLKEAEIDGFLVQQTHPSTESTKKTTTLSPSIHQVENSTAQIDEIEGSAAGNESFVAQGGENQTMTIQVFSSTTSSSTIGFTSHSPIATTPQADSSNSSSAKPDPSLVHGYIVDDDSHSGSGDGGLLDHSTAYSVTPVNSEFGTATSTVSHEDILPAHAGSGSGRSLIGLVEADAEKILQPVHGNPKVEAEAHKGHVTPDWIIILGFIVGVAALVMLCVAIATRDKWNGPREVRHPETQNISPNQQREQEMTTYLLQQAPRVNGKAGEYTVIPLEDLPDKC